MSNQEQKDENRPFHTEGGQIVFDSPVDTEKAAREKRESEQHEFQRAQVKTNKRIAIFSGFLVLATFCTIAVGIWQGILSRKAANAARDAANTSACALKKSQQQFEQTLKEMQGQTKAQQDAASAAKNALHVSDSAYVSTGAPVINLQQKTISIPIENKGHIPSGPIKILVSESTTIETPRPPEGPSFFTDACWHRIKMDTIDTGPSPISIGAGARYFDAEKIKNGLESFQIAIDVSYGDGFPHTPERHWKVCYVSITQNGSMWFSPCYLANEMKSIIKLSGYPNPTKICAIYPSE